MQQDVLKEVALLQSYITEFNRKKKEGGRIVFPANIVSSRIPIDVLRFVDLSTDARLEYYKGLTQARRNKTQFYVDFLPKDLSDVISEYIAHKKKYPGVSFPIPQIVYNQPPENQEIFVDSLINQGIIDKKYREQFLSSLQKKIPIDLKPAIPSLPTKKEALSLVYPAVSEIFPDFDISQSREVIFDEQGLDPSPNLELLTLALGGGGWAGILKSKSAIKYFTDLTKLYVKVETANTLWSNIALPVWSKVRGYTPQEQEEIDKLGRIVITNLIIFYPVLRTGLQYALDELLKTPQTTYLGKLISPFRFVGEADIPYKLKKLIGEEVAKKLGYTKPPTIPKYKSDFTENIRAWVTAPRTTKEFTMEHNKILIDYISASIETPDYVFIRTFKLPTTLGVRGENWLKALEISTGLRTYWIDFNNFIRAGTPLFSFIYRYSPSYRRYVDATDPEGYYQPEDGGVPPHTTFIAKRGLPPKPPVEEVVKPPTPIPKITSTLMIRPTANYEVLSRLKRALGVKNIEDLTFQRISDTEFRVVSEVGKFILYKSYLEGITGEHPLTQIKIGETFNLTTKQQLNDFEKVLLNPEYSPHRTLIKLFTKKHNHFIFYSVSQGNILLGNSHLIFIEPTTKTLPTPTTEKFMSLNMDVKGIMPKEKIAEGFLDVKQLYPAVHTIIHLTSKHKFGLSAPVVKNLYDVLKSIKAKTIKIEYFGKGKPVIMHTGIKKILVSQYDIEEAEKEIYVSKEEIDLQKVNEKELSFVYDPERKLRVEPIDEKSLEYKERIEKGKLISRQLVWENKDEGLKFIERLNRLHNPALWDKFVDYITELRAKIEAKFKPELAFSPQFILTYKNLGRDVLGRTVRNTIYSRLKEGVVASHELGHYIHNLIIKLYPDRFEQLKDLIEKYRHTELLTITKYVRPVFHLVGRGYTAYRMRWTELFADYFTAYLLDYDFVEQYAPNFTSKFNEFLVNNKLNDIINPTSGELFFKQNSEKSVISESLTDEIKERFSLPSFSSEAQKIITEKIFKPMQNFLTYFLDSLTLLELYENPTLTMIFNDLSAIMSEEGNAIIVDNFPTILELHNRYLGFSEDTKDKITKIVEYYKSVNRIPSYSELEEKFGRVGLKEAYDFFVDISKVYEAVMRQAIRFVEKYNPQLAQHFTAIVNDAVSKRGGYVSLHCPEGDIKIYGEALVEDKKYPFFYATDSLETAGKVLSQLADLGYTNFRLYGKHIFYNVIKVSPPDKTPKHITIFANTYEELAEKWEKIQKEYKHIERITGAIVYDTAAFLRDIPFNMFSIEQMLSILHSRNIELDDETYHKLVDALGRNPYWLRRHRSTAVDFTGYDLLVSLNNYMRYITNFVRNLAIKHTYTKYAPEIRKMPAEVQRVANGFFTKIRSTSAPLVAIGDYAFLTILATDLGYYIANLLQVPQALNFLSYKYGWHRVISAYQKAEISFATGKTIGKYGDTIAKIYNELKNSKEFQTGATQIMVRKRKFYPTTKQQLLGDLLRWINVGVNSLALLTEYHNRSIATLTSLYLFTDLYDEGYYPKVAGLTVKIDPNTPEGKEELKKAAIYVNNFLNLKYTSLDKPEILTKNNLGYLVWVFLSLPMRYGALSLINMTKNAIPQIVSRHMNYEIWSDYHRWDKKVFREVKELTQNIINRILFIAWILLFSGLFGFPGQRLIKKLYTKLVLKRKKQPNEFPELDFTTSIVFRGLISTITGLDLSKKLSYLDALERIASTRDFLAIRLLSDIFSTFQTLTEEDRKRFLQVFPVTLVKRMGSVDKVNDILRAFQQPELSPFERTLFILNLRPWRAMKFVHLNNYIRLIQKEVEEKKAKYHRRIADNLTEILKTFEKYSKKFSDKLTPQQVEKLKLDLARELSQYNTAVKNLLQDARKEGILLNVKTIIEQTQKSYKVYKEFISSLKAIVPYLFVEDIEKQFKELYENIELSNPNTDLETTIDKIIEEELGTNYY